MLMLFCPWRALIVCFVQELAVESVRQVMRDIGDDKREVEIKKYAKVEKIPGGAMQDCCVINGVMFTKDVVSPDRMRRRIVKPRILLLDCPLEYKKGENQAAVELKKEADFAELLRQEEEVRARFLHCSHVPYSGMWHLSKALCSTTLLRPWHTAADAASDILLSKHVYVQRCHVCALMHCLFCRRSRRWWTMCCASSLTSSLQRKA